MTRELLSYGAASFDVSLIEVEAGTINILLPLCRLALVEECLEVFSELMADMHHVCFLPNCHPDYRQVCT